MTLFKRRRIIGRKHEMSTNQIGPVMFTSVFKNTKCFFRLLQLVVNTKQTNSITLKTVHKINLAVRRWSQCITHAGHSIAFNMFLHSVTLWPLTSQTQNHNTSMYQVWTLWDHSFFELSCVQTYRHTYRITDRQTPLNTLLPWLQHLGSLTKATDSHWQ